LLRYEKGTYKGNSKLFYDGREESGSIIIVDA